MNTSAWLSVHRVEPCADLRTVLVEGAVREVELARARRALESIGFQVVEIQATRSLMAERRHVWLILSQTGNFSVSHLYDAAEGEHLLAEFEGAYFDMRT